MKRKTTFTARVKIACSAVLLSCFIAEAQAQCQQMAGEGIRPTDELATLEAWEVILQATDWGLWASWMGSSRTPGHAPGYVVQGYKVSCKAHQHGRVCVARATLCKAQ